MQEKADRVLKLISSKHILGTLRHIRESKSRFSELESIFPSERLRCIRLGELEELGVLKRVAEKRGKKTVLVYELTKRGLDFLENLERAIRKLS